MIDENGFLSIRRLSILGGASRIVLTAGLVLRALIRVILTMILIADISPTALWRLFSGISRIALCLPLRGIRPVIRRCFPILVTGPMRQLYRLICLHARQFSCKKAFWIPRVHARQQFKDEGR